jgi:nucleoside-triphosphatase
MDSLRKSDVIVCDEIGPMELKSREFMDAVRDLLDTDKKVIVVIHQKLQHHLTDDFRKEASLLINIDLENREKVIETLLERLIV